MDHRISSLPILALLLLAPPEAPAQGGELTTAQIIERMESATKAYRGKGFDLIPEEKAYWSLPVDVGVALDGAVRIRVPKPETRRGLTECTMVLAGGDFFNIEQILPRTPSLFMPRCRSERIASDSCDRIDPFLPGRNLITGRSSVHVLFHALSPRDAFRFERGLEVAGRRKRGGKDYHVLLSCRDIDNARTGFMRETGKYFIGIDDFRLSRVEQRLLHPQIHSSYWRTWTFDYSPEGVPVKLKLTSDPGNPGSSHGGWRGTREYRLQPADPGEARDRSVFVLPDGLYASQVRNPEVEKLLQGSPDDVDLNFSFALAASDPCTWRPRPPDRAPIIKALEKVIEKRASPVAMRCLFDQYEALNDLKGSLALAERVEKDPSSSPVTRLDAASAFVRAGQGERAFRLVDRIEGIPPARLRVPRASARLAAGDVRGGIGEFGEAGEDEAYWLYGRISQGPGALKGEMQVEALGQAARDHPRSPAILAARLMVLNRKVDIPQMADAVRMIFEAGISERLSDWALDALQRTLNARVDREVLIETLRREKEKVLAAVAAAPDPPASALRGQVFQILGDAAEASACFEKTCALVEANPGSFRCQLPMLMDLLRESGNEGLVRRMVKVALEVVRRPGAPPMNFSGKESDPVYLFARECLDAGRYRDLYRGLKGIDLEDHARFFEDDLKIRSKAIREAVKFAVAEAWRDKEDADGLKWLVMMMARHEPRGAAISLGLDLGAMYQEAVRRSPRDVDLLRSYLMWQEQVGLTRGMAATCEEILALLEAEVAREEPGERTRLILTLARFHRQEGDTEAARTALKRIDRERRNVTPDEALQAAEILKSVGDNDAAAAFLCFLHEEGYRPRFQLARVHMARGDWVEARRQLNRLMGGDWDWNYLPSGGFQPPPKPDSRTMRDIEKMREELEQKAGPDYFVNRLLASDLPRLNENEQRIAEDSFRKLSSDNAPERDEACERLRKIGPGCAPILKKGLESGDGEVRSRVRAILEDWAEPR